MDTAGGTKHKARPTAETNAAMQVTVEIMQTILLYKSGQIFEWGQQQKNLDEVLEPLNHS